MISLLSFWDKRGQVKALLRVPLLKTLFSHEYEETVEDTFSKKEKIDEYSCTFRITDPGGGFVDDASLRILTEKGNAFVLIYSIDDAESFEYIEGLIPKLISIKETFCFPIIVLGNKCDLEEGRAIPFFQGFNMTRKRRIPFLEISCLKAFQVQLAIKFLVRDVSYFTRFRYGDVPVPEEIRAFFKIGILGQKSTQKFDFVFAFLQKYGRNPILDKREVFFDLRIFSELNEELKLKYKVWFLLYSVHDVETFNFVKQSYQSIVEAHSPQTVPIVFIGLSSYSVSEKQVTLTDSFIRPFAKKKQAFEVTLGNVEQTEAAFFALFRLYSKIQQGSCLIF